MSNEKRDDETGDKSAEIVRSEPQDSPSHVGKYPPLSIDEGMVRSLGDYAKDIVNAITSANLESDRIRFQEKQIDVEDRKSARKHEERLAQWENAQEERREITIRYALPSIVAALAAIVIAAAASHSISDSVPLIVALATLAFGAVQQLMSGRPQWKRRRLPMPDKAEDDDT